MPSKGCAASRGCTVILAVLMACSNVLQARPTDLLCAEHTADQHHRECFGPLVPFLPDDA
jgi:hypothetical protein